MWCLWRFGDLDTNYNNLLYELKRLAESSNNSLSPSFIELKTLEVEKEFSNVHSCVDIFLALKTKGTLD